MIRERKYTKIKIIFFVLILAISIGLITYTNQIKTSSLQQSTHGLGAGIQKEKGFGVVSATSLGGENADLFNAVEATSDGGFIVGGEFNSYNLYFGREEIPYEVLTEKELKLDGMTSGITVKYDKSGKVAWADVVNAEEGVCITDIKETKDGDYIVVGFFEGYYIKVGDYILVNEGNCITQGFVIKYSSTGNIRWAKCLEDDNYIKIITAVEVTENDEYILVGSGIEYEISKARGTTMNDPNADGLVTCLDTNGNIKWTDYFGDEKQDVITSISLTNDSGFILGGLTLDTEALKNSAPSDITEILVDEVSEVMNDENEVPNALHGFVAKYKKGFSKPRKVNSDDVYGKEWYRTINDTTNNAVLSVVSTEDNGYAIAGGYNGNMKSVNNSLKEAECTNGMIIKYSENGNVEWANSLGDKCVNLFTSLLKTNTGDFITTGIFISPSTQIGEKEFRNIDYSYDSALIKYSKNGSLISSGSIESNMRSINFALKVAELETGKYVTVGGYIGAVGELSIGTTADDNLLLPHYSNAYPAQESVQMDGPNRGDADSIPIDAMIVKIEEKELVDPVISYATSIGENNDDEVYSVNATNDGGYIVGGYSKYQEMLPLFSTEADSSNKEYAFVKKYDKKDQLEWTSKIECDNEYERNVVTSVVQIKDGGYIAVGEFQAEKLKVDDYTIEKNGYINGFIIKYSKEGKVEWATAVGGEYGEDSLTSVAKTKDGGYVVGGYFSSNQLELANGTILHNKNIYMPKSAVNSSEGLVIKYNSNNEIEWAKTLSGYEDEIITSVAEVEDNRIIAVGMTSNSYEPPEVDGKPLEINYNYSVDSGSYTNNINENIDTSYAMKNYQRIDNNYPVGTIIEFLEDGKYEWGKVYEEYTAIDSVIPTKDNGFAIGGISREIGGIICKFDKYNEIDWATEIGPYYNGAIQLSETRDGGILVGGFFVGNYLQVGDYRLNNANLYNRFEHYPEDEQMVMSIIEEDYVDSETPDGLIAKYTIDGEVEWAESFGGLYDDMVQTVTELLDGSVVGGGYYSSEKIEKDEVTIENKGNKDGFILRITNIPSVRAETTITVKYQDTEGNALAEDIVMEGYEEDPYTTEEKQFDKYKLVEVRGEKEGIFTETSKEIVYVYEKIQGKVIIKYIEKITDKELAPQEELKGPVGEEYEVTRKNIENYKASEPEPENTKGVFTEEPITIVFYYRSKTTGEVKVEYVDKDTKEVLDSKIMNDDVGNEYTTEQLEFPYYKFVEVSGKTSGEYTENKITVTYYYQKYKLDFSVNKQLDNVKIDGQNVNFSNKNLIKLEVVGANIDKSDIEVTYNIEVKNIGELDGKVKLSELIANGFEIVNKDELFVENNSTLEAELELKAGESKNLKITLRWLKGNSNLGEQISETKITSISNEANFTDMDETNNTAKITMILAIKTGLQRNITIIITIIAILSIIIIIRKNNAKPKTKRRSCIY